MRDGFESERVRRGPQSLSALRLTLDAWAPRERERGRDVGMYSRLVTAGMVIPHGGIDSRPRLGTGGPIQASVRYVSTPTKVRRVTIQAMHLPPGSNKAQTDATISFKH